MKGYTLLPSEDYEALQNYRSVFQYNKDGTDMSKYKSIFKYSSTSLIQEAFLKQSKESSK